MRRGVSFAFFGVVLISVSDINNVSNWTPLLMLVVLGAGIFNLVNLLLTNYGFSRIKAVLASNILALESIFAILIGFLFFRELPNLKEIIGGVLILFSVIKMNKLV